MRIVTPVFFGILLAFATVAANQQTVMAQEAALVAPVDDASTKHKLKPATAASAQNCDVQNFKPTIAVVDLIDKGPSLELAKLRVAFTEMLAGELSQYRDLNVVERSRVEEFLREKHLQKGLADIDAAAVQRTGQALAAEYLLAGWFSGKDKTISLDVSLFQVGSKEPLLRWQRSGPVAKLGHLQKELANKVLKRLGIDKPQRRPLPEPKVGPSPLVAVLALRNSSVDAKLDPMESGFADILQANLGALENVRLVERKKLYEILKEQKLSLAGLVDPSTAVKVGRLLGAERLIYGSFVQLGGRLHLTVRLAGTQTTEILATEIANGQLDDFADLIESISLRLAADLAIEPQEDAAALVKASTPTRKLEAALHFATGEKFFHQGRFAEAARAFERVLLVESINVSAAMKRVKAWRHHKEYDKAIRAAEEALSGNAMLPKSTQRYELYSLLEVMLEQVGRYEECDRVFKRHFSEYPYLKSISAWRGAYAVILMRLGRRDEGVALIKQDLTDENLKTNPKLYLEAATALLDFYDRENDIIEWERNPTAGNNPQYMKRANEEAELKAEWEEIGKIFERVLQEAEGKRGEEWREWALRWKKIGTDFNLWEFIEDARKNPRTHRKSYIRHTKRRQRIVAAFDWIPEYAAMKDSVKFRVYLEKSKANTAAKLNAMSWLFGTPERGISVFWFNVIFSSKQSHYESKDQALARLHRELDQANAAIPKSPYYLLEAQIPSLSPIALAARGLRGQGKAWYKIAGLYKRNPEERELAISSYQHIFQDYGVTNGWTYEILKLLHKLDADIRLPEKSILIWGGEMVARKAWSKRLQPLGYSVHTVTLDHISTIDIIHYPLIILARGGKNSMAPTDVLALRHYVAIGGSLLVIVSPGWEQGQPWIHNPLLSFFDVRADDEMVVRAQSTQIAEHPITKGIKKTTAKCAVDLGGPSDTALIQSEGSTVLRAIPYRHGRVVVASYGQWFLPDPDLHVNELEVWGPKRNVPSKDWPVEANKGQEARLLRNVCDWLLEEREDRKLIVAQRAAFLATQLTAFKAKYCLQDYEAVRESVERLIDHAAPGLWKEEALWAGGELVFELYSGRPDQAYACWEHFRLMKKQRKANPGPDCYQRLIDEFSQSPLRPYAQWRLAELKRYEGKTSRPPWLSASYAQKVVRPKYLAVQAKEGTYAWAWTQLRLAQMCCDFGDYSQAASHARLVVEKMDYGSEKSMAIMDLALYCQLIKKYQLENDEKNPMDFGSFDDPADYRIDTKSEEAARLYRLARTIPNVRWFYRSNYRRWGLMTHSGFMATYSDTNDYAQRRLWRMGIETSPR